MVNSFKRVVSPPLVLAYAALEGVFVGAMSKVFQAAFGNGVVPGAVIGTIAAFAGTLAAYKVLNIRVTDKFRRFVVAAMFGFVGLVLLDLVLSFFGAEIGFNGFGGLGLIMSIVGLGLGILMLILDFDYVEQRRRRRAAGERVVAGRVRPDRDHRLDLHRAPADHGDPQGRLTSSSVTPKAPAVPHDVRGLRTSRPAVRSHA